MESMLARLEKRVTAGEGPVDIHEAAKITGLAEGTLYQWRSKGINLRSFKSGGKVVYDLADLLVFMRQQASGPSSAQEPAA